MSKTTTFEAWAVQRQKNMTLIGYDEPGVGPLLLSLDDADVHCRISGAYGAHHEPVRVRVTVEVIEDPAS